MIISQVTSRCQVTDGIVVGDFFNLKGLVAAQGEACQQDKQHDQKGFKGYTVNIATDTLPQGFYS